MRTHIALGVRDVKASQSFYETFLGQPAFRAQPGYVQFLTDHLNLALSEGDHHTPAPGHFGVEVMSSEDVQTALARVRGADVRVDVETDVSCCYARQDKFWASDPDGNRWEVFFVRERQMGPAQPTQGTCCQPA